jgi:hypothetical protein
MLMRSKDLGLVNEIEAQSLWRKYSRQGFKRKEPWDDKIPVEKPRIVAESFKVIVHNNIQSVSDILFRIRLPHYEIEELAGLSRNFLNDEARRFIELPLRNLASPQNHGDNPTQAKIIPFPESSVGNSF